MLKLDTRPLRDGYHELRVVATAADDVQTQGTSTVEIFVGRAVRLPPSSPPFVEWGKPLEIRADMVGPGRIEFRCNDVYLGAIEGGKASLPIDSRRLGMGPVRIQPTSFRTLSGTASMYKPLAVTVTPPAALPAQRIDGKSLAKGLLLLSGDRRIVLDTGDVGQAIAKAKLKSSEPFSLEGYFQVTAADLHQFQIRFDGKVELAVDGVAQEVGGAAGWRFVPVSLAAGLHHLRVRFEPARECKWSCDSATKVRNR